MSAFGGRAEVDFGHPNAPAENGMIHAIRARHAVWGPIMESVAKTIGRGTPLYSAALRAPLGKDPGGVAFAALAARLPVRDRRRLMDSFK